MDEAKADESSGEDSSSSSSSSEAARVGPGRRTVEDRQRAVLDLLAGKATVDQIARRLGVHASTVESWRRDALGGIAESLRRGTGKSARELELERELRTARDALTESAIAQALYKRALEEERKKRPTAPARSRR